MFYTSCDDTLALSGDWDMWHLATFTKVTNSTACVVSPRAAKDLWCAGIYARHDFANKPLEHSIQHISSREITQDTYEPALTPAILTAVSQKHDMTCRCRPWEKIPIGTLGTCHRLAILLGFFPQGHVPFSAPWINHVLGRIHPQHLVGRLGDVCL